MNNRRLPEIFADYGTYLEWVFPLVKRVKFQFKPFHLKLIDELNELVLGDPDRVRLMVNVFPRFGKTEIVSTFFPSWCYAINPKCNFLVLSYSDSIARQVISAGARSILRHPDYSRITDVKLSVDTAAKADWTTTEGGSFTARSIGGQVTGEGAGIRGVPGFNGALIIDDPIKPQLAFSDLVRGETNSLWTKVIKSRINDANTPIILIGQRVHPDDFFHMIKEKEDKTKWKVFKLPAMNREGKSVWEDIVTTKELEILQAADPNTFNYQYMQDVSSPVTQSLPAYPNFSRSVHLTKRVVPRQGQFPLCFSFDFNVFPYSTCVVLQRRNKNLVIRDLIIAKPPFSYTESLAKKVAEKYKIQKEPYVIMGDAAGRASTVRGKENDFQIIDRVFKEYGIHTPAKDIPKANPSVRPRISFLNRMLAEGEVRVNESLNLVISEFERINVSADGTKDKRKVKDPDTGIMFEPYGHISDAIEYAVTRLFYREYQSWVKGDIRDRKGEIIKPN